MADIKQELDLEEQDEPAGKAGACESLSARLSGRKSQIEVGLGGVAQMTLGIIWYTIEARYLLAMALQISSELPRWKLETAETENARLELRRTMQTLLSQARDEFRRLQADLMHREEVDWLDKLGQRLLRNCFFEIAHTYYLLAGYSIGLGSENYDKAIVAYGSATNKYPRDPQVLLAYLQMANCYDRLGKPADARSMLEQAKVILKQMPDDVFASPTTNWTKQQWQ